MTLSVQSYPRFISTIFSTNQPNAGGKVYTYITGTTTPQITYKDAQGVSPNTNPIILDADGGAFIWILNTADAAYDFIIKDANGNLVDTIIDVQQVAIVNNLTPAAGNLQINNYSIIDANQKKYEQFTATSNAANWLTITNAATTTGPTIGTGGGDTNIDLNLTAKGSGNVTLSGLEYPNADGTNGQAIITDGAGKLSFSSIATSGGTYPGYSVTTTGSSPGTIALTSAAGLSISTDGNLTMSAQQNMTLLTGINGGPAGPITLSPDGIPIVFTWAAAGGGVNGVISVGNLSGATYSMELRPPQGSGMGVVIRDNALNGVPLCLYSYGSGTYFTNIRANNSLSGNTDFVLPPDNGTAGETLHTDGFGNTYWGS